MVLYLANGKKPSIRLDCFTESSEELGRPRFLAARPMRSLGLCMTTRRLEGALALGRHPSNVACRYTERTIARESSHGKGARWGPRSVSF